MEIGNKYVRKDGELLVMAEESGGCEFVHAIAHARNSRSMVKFSNAFGEKSLVNALNGKKSYFFLQECVSAKTESALRKIAA